MITTITPELKQDAVAILKNMSVVVGNDMLIHGLYADDEVSRPDLYKAGAVCQGVKHCAIGSLWAAAGFKAKVEYDEEYDVFDVEEMEFVSERERHLAFQQVPALELAYDALNKCAEEFSARYNVEYPHEGGRYASGNYDFEAAVEHLFENGVIRDDEQINHNDLLIVIEDAIKLIEAT